MQKNILNLTTDQLKDIALSLESKIKQGLVKDNTEIRCIPTYIIPKKIKADGKALVLDLGGTNYRVATVDFVDGKPTVYPQNGWKKDLSVMKTPGFTEEQLFKEQADLITALKIETEMPIG